MDFVPFTLFFMVCLLSFQEKVSGKPATEADLKDLWAQKCTEELSFKNYCTQKLTGHGYPSVKELQKLYDDNIGKFDFRSQFNETGDRAGKTICRNYNYFDPYNRCEPTNSEDRILFFSAVKDITMIRDEHDNIRYTLYIPGLYEISIPVQECQPHASKMLDNKYKANNIKCVQKSYQYPFIVLSHDKKGLEFVKIKGLHSSCDPVQYY